MKNVQKIDLGLTGYDELFANDEERKRALPEWAKIGLQNALEIRQNEKSHPNERGEAR